MAHQLVPFERELHQINSCHLLHSYHGDLLLFNPCIVLHHQFQLLVHLHLFITIYDYLRFIKLKHYLDFLAYLDFASYHSASSAANSYCQFERANRGTADSEESYSCNTDTPNCSYFHLNIHRLHITHDKFLA